MFSEVTYGFALVGGSPILGDHVQHSSSPLTSMGITPPYPFMGDLWGIRVIICCVAGIAIEILGLRFDLRVGIPTQNI